MPVNIFPSLVYFVIILSPLYLSWIHYCSTPSLALVTVIYIFLLFTKKILCCFWLTIIHTLDKFQLKKVLKIYILFFCYCFTLFLVLKHHWTKMSVALVFFAFVHLFLVVIESFFFFSMGVSPSAKCSHFCGYIKKENCAILCANTTDRRKD